MTTDAELLPCPFCGGPAETMMGGLVGCMRCALARRDRSSWNRRSDLCASGQVRALPRAVGDDRKAGWTLSFEDLQDIRGAAGDWGYTLDLEAVESIALEVERRILAALTPAPQPEVAPMDNTALVDVAASLAAAISLLESGGKSAKKAAASDKMFDQMLADYRASLERARTALASREAPQPATPTAQEAVSGLRIHMVSSSFEGQEDMPDEPGVLLVGSVDAVNSAARMLGDEVVLYAHPPQPSETVADHSDLINRLEIKANMIALGERIDWGSDTEIMLEAAAALRALKGGAHG